MRRDGGRMSATYGEWCDALAAFWLKDASPGDLITLYLDDEDLSSVLHGGSAESLVQAVKTKVSMSGSHPFSQVLHENRQWEAAGCPGTNPSLPTVAVCVLAGTRMAAEGAIRPHNYYHRLAQLLANSDAGLTQARATLSSHFDSLIPVWQAASRWLLSLGFKSTIKPHPFYTRIGYPLSQAVVRRSDRYVLTQLWAAMGFPVGNPPSGERILRDAAIWLDRPRGLNGNLRSRILQGKQDSELGELLRDVATEWDGEIYTSTGRRTQTAALEGWGGAQPELVWVLGSESLPVDWDSFHSGALYEYEGGLWRVEPRKVSRLSHDPFSGRWKEAALALGEPQWVICGDELLPHVKSFAQAVFGAAFREKVKVRQVGPLRVLQFDAILDRDKLNRALRAFEASTSPLTTEEFRSGGVRERSFRVRLANGLRIRTPLGSNIYLTGGAPDLFYPTGVEDEGVIVTLDGASEILERSGLALPLSQLEWLTVGRHEGDVDDLPFSFYLVEADEDSPHYPDLRIDARSWHTPLVEAGNVLGAAVLDDSWQTGEASLIVIAKRGAEETLVVGPQGQCRRIEEPPASAFPREGGVEPHAFTFLRQRTEGWLVQIRHGRPSITQVVPVAANAKPTGQTDWPLWRELRRRLEGASIPPALTDVFAAGK